MSKLGLCAFLASLFCAPVAWSQTTGKILGYVVDQDGEPLPGVLITSVSADSVVTRDTVSRTNGSFSLVNLPPGLYGLTATMAGMQTQKKTVRVALSGTTEPVLVMAPGALSQTIRVEASGTPEIDGSQILTRLDQEFVDLWPYNRSSAAVAAFSPGVTTQGNGDVVIAGAIAGANTWLVDGADSRDDNLGSFTPRVLIEDAVQETVVLSGGVSAEYGQFSGGVINTITKSGSNILSGSARLQVTNPAWRGRDPVEAADGVSFENDLQDRLSFTLGGPIIKDKFWFFLAAQEEQFSPQGYFVQPTVLNDAQAAFYGIQASDTVRPTRPIPNQGNTQERYELKLTAEPKPGHRFSATFMSRDDYNKNASFVAMDASALADTEAHRDRFTLTYQTMINDNFNMEFQFSNRERVDIDRALPDHISAQLADGADLNEIGFGMSLLGFNGVTYMPGLIGGGDDYFGNDNWHIKGNYVLVSDGWGVHHLDFGVASNEDYARKNNAQTPNNWFITSDFKFTGDLVTPLYGPPNFPIGLVGTRLHYFPVLEAPQERRFRADSLYINDTWHLGEHWAFNLGLRFDMYDGQNQSGVTTADSDLLSPRLNVTYDLRGDGVHELSAGYSIYGQRIGDLANDSSVAGNISLYRLLYTGPVTQDPADVIAWLNNQYGDDFFQNPQNYDWQSLPWYAAADPTGSIFGTENPNGGYTPNKLKTPYAEEFRLGWHWRMGDRGYLRVDYVHRDWHDFYVEHTNTNIGRTEDGATDIILINNDDEGYEKTYDAVMTQFSYQLTDKWQLYGNYTWSQTIGNVEGGTPAGAVAGESILTRYPEWNSFDNRLPRRYLSTDGRHRATLFGIYRTQTAGGDLDLMISERILTGSPGDVQTEMILPLFPAYGLPPAQATSYANVPFFNYYHVGQVRGETALSTDIGFRWKRTIGKLEWFVEANLINLFNAHKASEGTKLDLQTRRGSPFNVHTDTPVEGVNYFVNPTFGQPISAGSFQTSRTFSLDLGIRF